MSSVDWDATGAMLQGIGSIAGAIALIFASLIGGSTFQSWRRQQLLQRQIPLAERILVVGFESRERVREVRSPIMHGAEIQAAREALIQSNVDLQSIGKKEAGRIENAQVHHDRLSQFNSTWIELQSCKASAYAHFGENVVASLDAILNVVHRIRVYSNALAQDDGSDRNFSRKILGILTSARATGEVDEIQSEIDNAITKLEETLKPILTESASQTQRAIMEMAKLALERTITVTVPWPISRFIP